MWFTFGAQEFTEEQKSTKDAVEVNNSVLNPPLDSPSNGQQPDPNNQGANQTSLLRTTAETAAVVGTAGVAIPAAATAGLTLAGFGSGGIVSGSIAAGLQASAGNIAAGSAFAGLQSVGATGGFAILGPVGIGAAAIGGGTYAGWKYWRNREGASQLENGIGNSGRPEDDGNVETATKTSRSKL